MKIARFSFDETIYYGVVVGDTVYEIDLDPFGPSGASLGSEEVTMGEGHSSGEVKLLAPSLPTKIIAVGLNYRAHAAEFDKELPTEPMIFFKPVSAVIGHGDEIIYPAHMSHRVDFEGELGVVIKKQARDLRPEETGEYILGYTCVNDVTARDLQGRDKQYARAKGFDTFSPIGPWVETDLDPDDVTIKTFLNGEVRQETSTSDMIFTASELVSFISQVMTLMPGDVIATGTPSGVGKMKPGDCVEVSIDGIGILKNSVA